MNGMGLMVSPILLGERRTVLLLRHTSAGGIAGWMVVWTLDLLWEGS
jgi:hypothetical protein